MYIYINIHGGVDTRASRAGSTKEKKKTHESADSSPACKDGTRAGAAVGAGSN